MQWLSTGGWAAVSRFAVRRGGGHRLEGACLPGSVAEERASVICLLDDRQDGPEVAQVAVVDPTIVELPSQFNE